MGSFRLRSRSTRNGKSTIFDSESLSDLAESTHRPDVGGRSERKTIPTDSGATRVFRRLDGIQPETEKRSPTERDGGDSALSPEEPSEVLEPLSLLSSDVCPVRASTTIKTRNIQRYRTDTLILYFMKG